MSNAVVTLKKGEGRAQKQGGAWIFDNEIASILGAYENGDIVLVRDFDGYPMGRGFINEHSKIRIRMMTRNIDQEIDEAFSFCRYRVPVTERPAHRRIYPLRVPAGSLPRQRSGGSLMCLSLFCGIPRHPALFFSKMLHRFPDRYLPDGF